MSTTKAQRTHSDSFARVTHPQAFKDDVRFESWLDRRTHWQLSHDFEFAVGGTLPSWLAKQDTSAAGTPTLDYVANQAAGLYRMKPDNTNEVQKITIYGGDQLLLDPSKDPWMVCRLKVDVAGTALTAVERLVAGMASARNATLDSVATMAWFKLEGANNNITTEADDGTTDTDDQDSTLDYADNTFLWLRTWIDYARLKAYFEVDLSTTGPANWQAAGAPISIPLVTSANLLQPFIEFQKDSGTATSDLLLDYIAIGAKR